MRLRSALLSIVAVAAVTSCSDDTATAPTPPDPQPTAPVLLRDVEIPSLPSPYYHFEYDAGGRVSHASYASGLTMYDVTYDRDRIAEMQNNIIVNHDRLVYVYDDAGRVASIRFTDQTGLVFTVLFFTYEGQKLTSMERDRRVTGGFLIDRTLTFSYYDDGNLREITDHRPPIDGVQPETTTNDRFEQYDNKINVDAFSLLHPDFFDHLILLPSVQLQKGNPARVTHTGDGLNYRVDYTYTYDDKNRPLRKAGEFTMLNGPNAGDKASPTLSVFTYY